RADPRGRPRPQPGAVSAAVPDRPGDAGPYADAHHARRVVLRAADAGPGGATLRAMAVPHGGPAAAGRARVRVERSGRGDPRGDPAGPGLERAAGVQGDR